MKKRLCLFLLLILLFVCISGASAAGASFGMRPYVSGSFGVNLCHPTAGYLEKYPGDESAGTPFFRTSSCLAVDAQLLEASVFFGNGSGISTGAGFSFINVSQSRPWGRSILKPYYGLGVSLDLAFSFSSRFALSAKYRYLHCTFTGSSAVFIAHDFELAPAYTVAAPWAVDIAVTLPLTVSLKADAISFRAGVGVQVFLDSRRMGGIE